jgi:DNA-binding response OmpR family regulator
MSVASNSRFANACILIVDDVDFTRRLIARALEKTGFRRIEVAENGAEALQKTYDLCPDLVILDLNMPKLDGFGYCELVRGDPNLPRMPIIVQTAIEERKARLHALSCGADDFLTKPLDMDELSLRICVHIERYFMLRDMSDMCAYLEMEVEQAQKLRSYIEQAEAAESGTDLLDKHLDVMRELIEFSSAS